MSSPWDHNGSPRRYYGSGWSNRIGRFGRHSSTVRAVRALSVTDLLDRIRGLGCRSGDMRLAYGWRAAVIRTAVVATVVGIGSRVALTALFVWFVTDGIVPVTWFNVAVTVLGTVSLGLAHARGLDLALPPLGGGRGARSPPPRAASTRRPRGAWTPRWRPGRRDRLADPPGRAVSRPGSLRALARRRRGITVRLLGYCLSCVNRTRSSP